MAFFLFIDESGYDLRESPYAVLAGVCVEDRDLWNLIDAIKNAEVFYFGLPYSRAKEEFKAKKFLNRSVFRHANQEPLLPIEERRILAREIIEDGSKPTRARLTALAQSKLAFVRKVLDICSQFHCSVFASIVPADAPRPPEGALRKDYVYLFERYFYFLEDRGRSERGIVVFDELDKARSKILLDQMGAYFLKSVKGQVRSRQIIPEPFFVHSDLTTLVQVADLVAYIIAWAYRYTPRMTAPARSELTAYAKQVRHLGYLTERGHEGKRLKVWSLTCIPDLRGLSERTQQLAMDEMFEKKGNETLSPKVDDRAPKPPSQT